MFGNHRSSYCFRKHISEINYSDKESFLTNQLLNKKKSIYIRFLISHTETRQINYEI